MIKFNDKVRKSRQDENPEKQSREENTFKKN